jgi:hypothetical protein
VVGHVRQALQVTGKSIKRESDPYFILIGKQKSSSQSVQSQVVGEPLPTRPTVSITPPKIEVHPDEVVPPSVEQPMGDQPERVEEIQHEDFKPTPTVEQRRFSAPHSEWDPAR